MFFLEISTFFGRFHPLLVHLPIGFLILAVLISIKQKDKNLTYTKILRLIWFLAFISSFFSAIMGLLLAQNGHYIENDLSLHKWTGIALVCLSFLGWLFHLNLFNISVLVKKINNSFIILLIFIVGHLGGSLTHGKDYLFRFSPEVVRTKLITKTKPISFKKASLDSVYVFNDIIQPLFNNKCVACHNEIIKRGSLNMTTSLNLLEGGKSGAAIVPKDLGKSLAFKRVTLSQNDQEFMPPTGIPLNYEEYVSKIESDRTYADQFDAVEEYDNNLDFTFSPADQKRISGDDIFLEKRERWFSNLSKDFYVEEAVNILQGLKVGIYQQEPLAKK